jgi:hypothetical protein
MFGILASLTLRQVTGKNKQQKKQTLNSLWCKEARFRLGVPDTKKNLEKAAKVKIQKYRDAATDWRARVQPLPYTTFGATSRYTAKWLTDVEATAKNNAQYFPELDRKFSVVWRENISFSIARETAKAAFEASAHHQTLMDLVQGTLE